VTPLLVSGCACLAWPSRHLREGGFGSRRGASPAEIEREREVGEEGAQGGGGTEGQPVCLHTDLRSPQGPPLPPLRPPPELEAEEVLGGESGTSGVGGRELHHRQAEDLPR
jgi:hypothetical protein